MTMWIPSAMTLIGPYRFSSRFASVWQNKRHFDSGDVRNVTTDRSFDSLT